MAIPTKIGLFAAFLFAYVFYLYVSQKLAQPRDKPFEHEHLLSIYLFVIVQMAAFFGFIWILTSFFDLSLSLLFAVVLHVGVVFVLLLSLFVSSPEVAWRARTSFAGGEWGAAHPRLMRAFQLFILCVLFAYPIANGYLLFKHDLPSDTLTLNIFKTSLLFFFWGGLIIILPVSVVVLASENTDESTRARILVARLSDFFVGALFLSLTLWAFGVASTQYRWQIGAMTLSISPVLIAFMIAFFLCAFFLPYLAGWKRAKRWRHYLASRQRYWTDELAGAYAFPDQATAVARLRQLQQTLGDETRDFADRQPGVRLGLELERLAAEPLPHALQQLQQAYRLSRPHDPRFAYVDFLEGLRGEIERAAAQLEGLPTHEAAMQRAKEYAAHYRERRSSIAAETTMREEGRPLLLAAVGFVLSGLASPLFSEAGKWMWGAVVGTLAAGAAG